MIVASFEVRKDRVSALSVQAIKVTPLKICFMNPVTLTRLLPGISNILLKIKGSEKGPQRK